MPNKKIRKLFKCLYGVLLYNIKLNGCESKTLCRKDRDHFGKW